MQVMVLTRTLSAALLGGLLVGAVPQIESLGTQTANTRSARYDEGAACQWSLELPPAETHSADRLAAVANEGITVGKKPAKDYVKAKVFLSVDKLPAGEKCKFVVILDVQEGWHVNANPPSPENMIPTTVTIQSKQKTRQLDTTYPKGTELAVEELDEPVHVYEGEVQIRGEVQAAKDAAGKSEELEFQIRYQACNEKNCLPPKTLKLTGKIDIVKAGTAVKQINTKYFGAKTANSDQ